MATASKTLEQYREEERAKNKALADADVGVSNSIYDTQKQNTQNLYQGKIRDTVSSYENALRSNETQRFLNSRAIERRMAEMGLTDSGLNRTQQTAVQLSAANNQGEIQRQRQAAVDTLARTMASELSTIENERAAKEQAIRSGYTSEADSRATSLYNADLQSATDLETANINAAAKVRAAQIEAASKAEGTTKPKGLIWGKNSVVSRDFEGSLLDNNIRVMENADGTYTYYDSVSGYDSTFKKGENPFTGTTNEYLLDKDGKYDASKAFKNTHYQPNNIGGVPLKAAAVNGKAARITWNGNKQKVWLKNGDANGPAYVWDGASNEYIELNNAERAAVGLLPIKE